MSLYTVDPDISGLSLENINEFTDEVLPSFATEARDFALAIASQQSMTMEVFDFIQQGLEVRTQGNSIVIRTEGKADFFEKGWGAMDLGQGILDGAKNVKISKDGNRYAHVPIYPKGVTPVNPITKKGYRSRALNPAAMASEDNPYGIQKKTRTLIADARRYARAEGNLKYKNEKLPKYNTGGGTFRTVSDKSLNWQHPGIEGFKYAEMASEYMKDALEAFIFLNYTDQK